METLTLACGPYFSEVGLAATLGVLGVVKPLTYFAFIQAFRYRVSREIPMPFKRAAWLAGMRALLGVTIAAAAWAMLMWLGPRGLGVWPAWVVLMVERVVVWFAIGRRGAGLVGRRLAGWTISGAAIDAAYDGAIGGSMMVGVWPHAVAAAVIGAFLWALHVIGRRESLRRRFDAFPRCAACGYDLRGNLSGVCPECGAKLGAVVPAAVALA